MSNDWSSLLIFWVPKTFTSQTVLPQTHAAYLIGSGKLHSTCTPVLGRYPYSWYFNTQEFPLLLKLLLHQWPLNASHGVRTQLLSMTLQSQYHVGDSYTLPMLSSSLTFVENLWNWSLNIAYLHIIICKLYHKGPHVKNYEGRR